MANREPAEAAALEADAARAQRLRVAFRALVAATRDRLAALYAGTASDAEKRAGKAEAFAAMRAEYERQKAASAGVTAFDRWFAGGANNAGIVAAGLYADRVPQFAALLAAEDGDLVRFYARVVGPGGDARGAARSGIGGRRAFLADPGVPSRGEAVRRSAYPLVLQRKYSYNPKFPCLTPSRPGEAARRR